MINSENIYYRDISVLYKKYYEIIPKLSDSRTKQTNIIVRVCIYLLLLLFIINQKDSLYIPFSILVLATIFYIIHDKDENKKEKDFDRKINLRRKEKSDEKEKYKKFKKMPNSFMESNNLSEFKENELSGNNFEVGILDSDGKINYGKYYGPETDTYEKIDNLYTSEEKEEYQKATCRRPTYENPFMNPSPTDFNNDKDNIPQACNVDDEEINNDINLKFHEKMFRNIDDVFDRENSIRQFYTLPSTSIPNNQIEFAKWCYDNGGGCMVNQNKCLRYEDLRHKRKRI